MDRIIKAREYQAMPLVKRYVMLEQDRIGATAYTRASDDWKHEILIEGFHSRSSGDRRRLAARGVYEGLIFEVDLDADQPPSGESA